MERIKPEPYVTLADLAEQTYPQLRQGLRDRGLDPDEAPVPPIRIVHFGRSMLRVDACGRAVAAIHSLTYSPFDDPEEDPVGYQLCVPSEDRKRERAIVAQLRRDDEERRQSQRGSDVRP